MKTASLIIILIAVSAFASAQGKLLEELAGNLLGNAANKFVGQQVDSLLDRDLDKLNGRLNEGKSLIFPDGSVVTFEVDRNDTNMSDEELIAVAKSNVKHWGKGLKIGLNANERRQQRDRNVDDRDNEEVRNPIPKGRLERSYFDLHLVARSARGYDGLSADVGSLFQRLLGRSFGFSSYGDTEFVELSMDAKEADTGLVDADSGTLTVVGASPGSRRLSVDAGRISFDNESGNNLNGAARNAFTRLTKVIRGEDKSKK
ncbi:MAG: hypothetical protein NUV80_05965 [Candidatus Berkelbacteria bacterium]|nr:hypothetical protein [Candidatus Berkelbacteria bacterium]